jgi:hypothetical protein
MKLNLALALGVLLFVGHCANNRTPVRQEVHNLVECDQESCFIEGGGRVYGPHLQEGLQEVLIQKGNRPTILRSSPVLGKEYLGKVTDIAPAGAEYVVTADGEQYIVADCKKGAQLFKKGLTLSCE